jgi:hypothetical protein
MDLYKAIKDLYEQKKRLDLVIASLEELEKTAGSAAMEPPKRRGRPNMDAEARREVSERMKHYWAKRRREGKAVQPKPRRQPERPNPPA